MLLRSYLRLIALIGVLLSAQVISAQEDSWQKIAPAGMTFTISMPARTLGVMHTIEWNDKRDIIHVNLYESLTPGRRYLAGEFFKTPAYRFDGLASFDGFVAGIEYSFR